MKFIFVWDNDPQEFVKAAKRLLTDAEKVLGKQAGAATEEIAAAEQAVQATRKRADRLGKQVANVRNASDLL
ncbi:hypothetical protein A3J33_00695 [candidate division WWE3 bacterium RIFCSPLOWO2_02_FULL_53_10]|uniref:Uncharacterized protein n=2 Tax=Katanobacteria TaxID=422282 RepID=A0A1F4WNL7_UNCKA|nr:MAG: hypothetical protein A2890_00045 [candidate division WWE3 bacterium RIFCSPLOWO2_01_FULL_53_14]OGC70961.1 MAG: hypothetical protein A3J33_00695 [candidate division WWE3 bacterium RIFCSPLOWO2_02_FULL_53_10]